MKQTNNTDHQLSREKMQLSPLNNFSRDSSLDLFFVLKLHFILNRKTKLHFILNRAVFALWVCVISIRNQMAIVFAPESPEYSIDLHPL